MMVGSARTGPTITGPIRWRYATLNCGVIACAIYATVQEGWDFNGDGVLTAQDIVFVLVRLLAFPVHALLELTPAPILELLGLPDAPWPATAFVAVAVGLPLWGMFVIGSLVFEAWLELTAGSGRRLGPGSLGGLTRR